MYGSRLSKVHYHGTHHNNNKTLPSQHEKVILADPVARIVPSRGLGNGICGIRDGMPSRSRHALPGSPGIVSPWTIGYDHVSVGICYSLFRFLFS